MSDLERIAREAGFDLEHPAAWGEIGEDESGRPVWIGASVTPPAHPNFRFVALHTLTAEKMARFADLIRADERERLATWIEPQRNDVPATGSEFAAAIRASR